MFYTFRCSNHLFSVVSMRASLVYGRACAPGGRDFVYFSTKNLQALIFRACAFLFIFSLARNFVPETGILGASSEKKIAQRRRELAYFRRKSQSTRKYEELYSLSLYSSTVEHNTVNIMIDVRFILGAFNMCIKLKDL